MPILQMRACVHVAVGMRVHYGCPEMSMDDPGSDRFFKRNHGKVGTIVGFPERYVGVLDPEGCLPGVYYRTDSIDVQFLGEDTVHRALNLEHFALLDMGVTVVPGVNLGEQRVRDLPTPILFYPDDLVYKLSDPGRAPRSIYGVCVSGEGAVTYLLAETPEARAQREKEVCAYRAQSGGRECVVITRSSMDPPRPEPSDSSDLTLLARGNVYHLYHAPDKLAFDSPELEVLFWGRRGISRSVFNRRGWGWTLATAREMVEGGRGDLITQSKMYGDAAGGKGPRFEVWALLPCFSQHRERVRALFLNVTQPPLDAGEDIRRHTAVSPTTH